MVGCGHMDITPILKKLGLSEKETRVYHACLSEGPSPVRALAEASGVNRGTTYNILKYLIDLGLVSYYHKETRQYFVAEDPAKLLDVFSAKQEELERSKHEVADALPTLRSLFQKAGGGPVVRYYEGKKGVRTILEDVLSVVNEEKKKSYDVYSSSSIRGALRETFPTFTKERIKRKINVRVIAIGEGGEEAQRAERRWLTRAAGAPTYSLLYGEKTAFISLDTVGTPICAIVEDKGITETQKIIFEHLWRTLL